MESVHIRDSMLDCNELLPKISDLAEKAGRIAMQFFQKDRARELKKDQSPVTQADMQIHAFLMESLHALTPALHVVSEESAEHPSGFDQESGYWLVDPLDGTKEFLKGTPEFTVNIALVRNHSPVLGVVHAPAMSVTYTGIAGVGAWRHSKEQGGSRIRVRAPDMNHLRIVASKDHSGPGVKRLLDSLRSAETSSIGSSLKFCLVAEGHADIYLRDLPTMEWDTAAAQCVLEAAGGVVLGPDGGALRYGKPGLKNSAFVALGTRACWPLIEGINPPLSRQ